jgi:hypothetical protein
MEVTVLSYEDCVGMSGLTPEEIAAIARHEHLPEIVAAEMGAFLFGTADGTRQIQRMIAERSDEVCCRGDTRSAARLGLVLHRFLEAQMDRHEKSDSSDRGDIEGRVPTAGCARERTDNYLAAMLHCFGLDRVSAEERFGPEMRIAEMCCAACEEADRCRRFFLKQAPIQEEAPSDFCPIAPLLKALGVSARSAASPAPVPSG